MTAATLFGCNCNNSTQGGEQKIDPSKITNPVFTMNAFEDYGDLWMWKINKTFGEVNLNTDKAYIKDGNGSAQLKITNEPYLAGDRGIASMNSVTRKIPYYNEQTENWSDFTYVFLVTLDVYNPNAYAVQVAIQLFYDETTFSIPQFVSVAPNAWTTVECPIQREFIPKTKPDRYSDPIAKVDSITLQFSRNWEETYTLYIDNLLLYKSTTEVEPATLALQENEVCSFDEYWQYKKFKLFCYTDAYLPTVSWVQLPDEPERGGILKVNTVDRSADTSGTDWPQINLPAECYSLFFNNVDNPDRFAYADDDMFAFDVFIPEEAYMITTIYLELAYGGMSFTTKAFPIGSGVYGDSFNATLDEIQTLSDVELEARRFRNGSYDNPYGQWHTIAFTVQELNTDRRSTYNIEKYKQHGVEYVNRVGGTASFPYTFADCTNIRVTYRSKFGEAASYFYVDNFRMIVAD